MPSSIALNIPETQAALLEQGQLWHIIQEMLDGVLVFQQDGQILMKNRSFEALSKPATGNTLEQLFTSIAPQLPMQLLEVFNIEVFNGERSLTFPIELQQGPKPQYYSITVVPMLTSGQPTSCEAFAVFHDVTDSQKTEKMRRDFVANVSHELRTPLSAIHGYAETLLEGAIEDPPVAKDFVQIIFNHAQRLSLLVRDLLDLSKIEAPDFQVELAPIALDTVLDKVLSLQAGSLQEKEITLHQVKDTQVKDSTAAIWVLAHEGGLEQVLTNLLDNAIKYTPEQGKITLKTHMSSHQPGYYQIDVIDSGIGIEPKHIPRLFERFYRIDKARSRDLGGTGLGLAIVRHIVQYHGGQIWVTSTPGKGSCFSFTLQCVSYNLLIQNSI